MLGVAAALPAGAEASVQVNVTPLVALLYAFGVEPQLPPATSLASKAFAVSVTLVVAPGDDSFTGTRELGAVTLTMVGAPVPQLVVMKLKNAGALLRPVESVTTSWTR